VITKKLQLDSDEEALLLLGEQDIRLRDMEKRFGVEIFVRHDPASEAVFLSIRGQTNRVDKTLRWLKDFRLQLKRGAPAPVESSLVTAMGPPLPKDGVYVSAFGKPILARTPRQKIYVESIRTKDLTIGIGPAGTGKTFLAVAAALRALQEREVIRIILTRPVVEAGEHLGYLPGDIYEKVHPYLKPLYDAFYLMLGPEKFRLWREDEVVEIVPLAYMRGRTLERAFIILDEAQNTTPEQMKMFLTRMGMGSRVVVTGDVTQIDLAQKSQSGLTVIREILKDIPDVQFVEFNEEDVVRHPLVRRIIRAYDHYEKKNK